MTPTNRGWLGRRQRRQSDLRASGESKEITWKPGSSSLWQATGSTRTPGAARLLLEMPEEDQRFGGYHTAIRQPRTEDGQKVGRITSYLAGPEFYERRKRFEECVFRGQK